MIGVQNDSVFVHRYAGFDNFGRVVDQKWYDYDSSADAARIKHGYDQASNRLYREDSVADSNNVDVDELYDYLCPCQLPGEDFLVLAAWFEGRWFCCLPKAGAAVGACFALAS